MTIIESGSLQLRLAHGETPIAQSEASPLGSFTLANNGNARSFDYRGRYGLEHAYKRRRSWRKVAIIALIAMSPLGLLLAWQTGAFQPPTLSHKHPVRRASSSLDAVAYRIGERLITRGQLLKPERIPPVELVKSFSLNHPAHAGVEPAVGHQAVLVAPR